VDIQVRTSKQVDFVDITERVRQFVRESGVRDGLCVVFVPHTTAGVTINENADPDVVSDMTMALDRAVPANLPYRHGEGNSPAHVKASLMGSSVTLLVDEGDLQLGVWQAVYLTEFDGPRTRRVLMQVYGK
jgi:secondary thiamine-phosphate synthase enzyme